jgi:hypothetical protein
VKNAAGIQFWTFYPDRALMQFRKTAGESQSQTCALVFSADRALNQINYFQEKSLINKRNITIVSFGKNSLPAAATGGRSSGTPP